MRSLEGRREAAYATRLGHVAHAPPTRILLEGGRLAAELALLSVAPDLGEVGPIAQERWGRDWGEVGERWGEMARLRATQKRRPQSASLSARA